jgi:hypothetical protein
MHALAHALVAGLVFVFAGCSADTAGGGPSPSGDAATIDAAGADASAPADAAGSGADAGAAADTAASGFPKGEGVKTDVDRTEPCKASEVGNFRPAPVDGTLAQACLPNYLVWAPVVCGGPKPPCACDASRCLPNEVAKVVSGEFCICLSPCTTQASGAKCGAGNTRKCIPIDDVTKKQVFICGGAG